MSSDEFSRTPSADETAAAVGAELAEFSRTVLRRALRAVLRLLKVAASNWKRDPEHVHRLRVAARKAQTALLLFSEWTPSEHADWFRRTLKAILRAAGQARDLDVLLHTQLPRCGTAQPRLRRRWQADRRTLQKPISALAEKMLDRRRFRRHLRKLIRGLSGQQPHADLETTADPRPTDSAIWARRRLAEVGQLFFDAIPRQADFESLHLLRRRAKRFRYSIELLRPLLRNPEIKQLKSKLADLQEQLGTLQDHVVAHCQFQLSLAQVNKSSHQQLLEQLIHFEHEQMEACAARLQEWTQSQDLQLLRSSFHSATPGPASADVSPGN